MADKDFFQTLRERFTYGLAQDASDRRRAEEDARFAAGEQWDAKVKRARGKRPCLTENRLAASISQVVNDGRQNKPAILAVPMDNGTPETADYFEGRIRHIEYECDADQAYDTARRGQVTSGRGWLRVCTQYKRGKAGEQEISIEAIPNQFSVVCDPNARRYDRQDARWLFVVRTMSREAYIDEFGETDGIRSFDASGINSAPGWLGLGEDGRSVQVADYYVREEDEDGESTVCIYCTNGVEILDETEWIGSTIPLLPMWGEEDVIDGERRTYSLVYHAKDAQRLVNLYVSNIAEQISQMPKNPYLVPVGGIAGREAEWATINDVQRAVAQYNVFDATGRPIPPPTRNAAEPPIQALVTGYLQAVDAVKAAMGIFDASLGARSNETSGLAINARKKEGDEANFHFADNEARTRKALGRILLEIIPIVDGTKPAMKPVRALDGKTAMTRINAPYAHPKTGKPVIHNMADPGDYGIAIREGASYASQREQENQRQGELIQAVPELMWVMGDLYFRTSDTPGAEIIADRMERAIAMRSPGLIDAGQDAQKQIGQMKAQLAQTGQQNQMLTAKIHELSQVVETKAAETASRERIAAAEIASKERIAALNAWTTVRAAEVKAKLAEGIAEADRDAERLENMFDRAHEAALGAADHARGMQAQQAQQDHAADMQDAAAAQAQQQAQQQAQPQQQAQQQAQPQQAQPQPLPEAA